MVSRLRRRYLPQPRSAAEMVDNWTQAADEISLPRLDEVGGHVRPREVGLTYAELEHHALADEQELIWAAEGEREARGDQMQAHGVAAAVTATEFVLAKSGTEVQASHTDHQHAAKVLTPYVRREPGAKLRYWICWPLLILGDMAGVWSAAVILGDLPFIAFWQALASGLAAGCAGLIGSELKDIRLARARRRGPDSLTDDELRYRRLFTGTDEGLGITKLMGLLSVFVVVLIAVAIFTLRSSIEGIESGATFGLLAAATAIGSGLLGYSAADEVADVLAVSAKRVRQAERRYLALAGSKPSRLRARAEEAARSIQAEHRLRGQGAAKRVESLSWRVQRRNPQVVGHGYPIGERERGDAVGRQVRRGGVS